MKNKILICLYNKTAQDDMKLLESFDENGFEVHLFENLYLENLEEIDLKNIVENINDKNVSNDDIYIISDIEKLLLKMFTKYSWEYGVFIFASKNIQNSESMNIDEWKVSEYNCNLYSFEKWNNDLYYNVLNEKLDFNFSFNQLENLIVSSKEICDDYKTFIFNYKKVEIKANLVKERINNLDDSYKTKVEERLIKELDNDNEQYRIYIASLLLNIYKKNIYINEILKTSLDSKVLDKNNRFFILYQMIRFGFINNGAGDGITSRLREDLYDKVFNEFLQSVGEQKFIPKDRRDKNLVFVFTSQFLSIEHAPTKTALDRCYALIKHMKKRVILINTKDVMTTKGIIPIHNVSCGSEIEEYQKLNSVKYKDIDIPYYQTSFNMPDEVECINILNMVKKYKPYLIFTIGGANITADLCSKIVPTATISTVYSSMPMTKGSFFVMGRKATDDDYNYVVKRNYSKEALIDSRFTFDFKKQMNSYSRKIFKIPEDKFVVTMIGGRLQQEVDNEFIEVLDNIASIGCFIVSIGGFELSEEVKKKYPNLRDNFLDMGFQGDVLACVELVDLYINPNRAGGGSSSVECMYKGKPVVSLNHGDVATAVGEEFLVNDYDEMITMVKKYKDDKKFYESMSSKAKVRAEDLMDTKKHFNDIYNRIIFNKVFK